MTLMQTPTSKPPLKKEGAPKEEAPEEIGVETLYKSYSRSLRTYARGRGLPEAVAEDVVNQVFANLWSNKEGFRELPDGQSPFTWLCHRVLGQISNLRATKHQQALTLTEPDVLDERPNQLDDSPSQRLARRQLLALWAEACRGLDQDMVHTYQLVRVMGLTMEEAAAYQQVPLSRIASRLRTAQTVLLPISRRLQQQVTTLRLQA